MNCGLYNGQHGVINGRTALIRLSRHLHVAFIGQGATSSYTYPVVLARLWI